MDKLQTIGANASRVFSIYRAMKRGFDLYRVEWEQVRDARTEYELAEQEYQLARKEAGLPYLLHAAGE